MFPRKHDVVTTSNIAFFGSGPNFSSGFAFIQSFFRFKYVLLGLGPKGFVQNLI